MHRLDRTAKLRRRLGGLAAVLLLGTIGTPRVGAGEEVDYLREVRPIFATRCAKCHSGAFKQEGGLRLDAPDMIAKGGDDGPIFVAGQSAASPLIARVTASGDQRMPPEGDPLTAKQVDTLRRWIDQGAKLPSGDATIRHWSLESLQPPSLPAVARTERLRGPVDVWLEQQREAQQVASVDPASRPILVRRLYLDLLGLPPTEEQVSDYVADERPDALERLADRLLASPGYGERWGRHWMDVWRYSDWDGYGAEVRESQPHVWRWRDWIIDSLNADKPYNRMIVEMLAGDEVAPDDPQTLRATGFLVRNWFKFNRNVWLDNTVEHTGKAFLGLTLNCARCHDHMYDSIRQTEYYGLRAIFEPYDVRTDRRPGQVDTAKDGLVRSFDAKLDTPTFVFTRGDEKQPEKERAVPPAIPAWLAAGKPWTVAPVALRPAAYYPNSQPFVHEEALAAARQEIVKTEAAGQTARQSLAMARKQWQDAVAARVATRSPAPTVPAPTPPTPPPAADAAKETPKIVWADDFKAARPELWKSGQGKFEYADGKLLQREPLDAQCGIVSQATHPRDFAVKFRFKITGGKMYRSLGLSFDAVDEQEANFVYVSAYAQGPKVQAGHRRGGRDEYPTDAAKGLPIEVGREYELLVAVRDHLVNVSLDGQLQLVHRVPSRPADGRIVLWCYDATGEFLRAELTTLPVHLPLVDRSGEPVSGAAPAAGPAPEAALEAKAQQAELAAAAAEKTAEAAKAGLLATTARVAADRATYADPPASDAKTLAVAAVKAEREQALLAAEAKSLDAQLKLSLARANAKPGDDKSQKAVTDADKAAADAATAIDTARNTLKQESDQYTRFGPLYPATSSGRRLALAQWIASDDNPLTPRVAINHLWLRHFGTPLVASVFDFGANGQPPTHPALLDWLAREFVASGWSMKSVHRALVTSDAYRLSSTASGAGGANKSRDPENKWFWRMNSRRMEAELVRDATLAVAGNLNRQFFGPDLDPAAGLTLGRRSVYFRTSKEKRMTFLALFDSANVSECYRRSESVAPQQALAMVNSSLTLAQARLLAAELGRSVPDPDETFVDAAYSRVLGRSPSDAERGECVRFLTGQADRFRNPKGLTAFSGAGEANVKPSVDPRQRARENLVHVLLNHNDFLTIR